MDEGEKQGKYSTFHIFGLFLIIIGFIGGTSGMDRTESQIIGGLFISLIGVALIIIGFAKKKNNPD